MVVARYKSPPIKRFRFSTGSVLADKYEVLERLGSGWEGEVYKLRERGTGIERAAKFFFPRRNPGGRTTRFHARKLHKLRECPILVKYHARETIDYLGWPINCIISEFVEGEQLSRFVARLPTRRMTPFSGLHLLYAMARGVEEIHRRGEYHGDLHADNIIVRQHGIGFDVKLIDMYYWGQPSAACIRDDVFDLIKLFHDAIGGCRCYSRLPDAIKNIVCGLKRSLVAKRFRDAGDLRSHLESMSWDNDG